MFTVLPQVTQQFITSDVSKLPPRLRESSTRNDHSTRSLQELAWVSCLQLTECILRIHPTTVSLS